MALMLLCLPYTYLFLSQMTAVFGPLLGGSSSAPSGILPQPLTLCMFKRTDISAFCTLNKIFFVAVLLSLPCLHEKMQWKKTPAPSTYMK